MKTLFKNRLSVIIASILMIVVLCFAGCETKDDTGTTNNQPTIVKLTLDNYKEYFAIKEEIADYDRKDSSASLGTWVKINQTTKFSIVQLKANLTFNNVIITFFNDTKTGMIVTATGKPVYRWTGEGGKLVLSYDGSGSLILRATFSNYIDYVSSNPMKYGIDKIEGSITIK